MQKTSACAFGLFLFFFAFVQTAGAQTDCNGKNLFTEKRCLGDEASGLEQELLKLINDYRGQNNLPQIMLNDSLSALANRRLLDLSLNVKTLTHSWSNCPYDIKIQSTWNCVIESPKRLNVGFGGQGYENLYRTRSGEASPSLALEAWKKSELHKSLILNLNFFSQKKWDACGIAIRGKYVALWFGSTSNEMGTGSVLTAYFDNTVKKIGGGASIRRTNSNELSISGSSVDKSLVLTVSGSGDDISKAIVLIRLKLEKNFELGLKNKNILKTFLANTAATWKDSEGWITASVQKIRRDPKFAASTFQGGKNFTLNRDADNYLCRTVTAAGK